MAVSPQVEVRPQGLGQDGPGEPPLTHGARCGAQGEARADVEGEAGDLGVVDGDWDENPFPIELHVGPMFSGKTTALLRKVKELRELGEQVVVVKAAIDDRYSGSEVISHDGERLPADEVVERLEQAAIPVGGWVAIEELHMFPDFNSTCKLW